MRLVPLILVTGPVRSGKSAFAARLAEQSGAPITYVATAMHDTDDPEMEERIRHHRSQRPPYWHTIESAGLPEDEFRAILESAAAKECLLIDSLGTLLAAKLYELREIVDRDSVRAANEIELWAKGFTTHIASLPAQTIVVAEQVGWEVVPVAASARVFRDVLGRMQQRLAAEASSVYLTIAGIAIDLRRLGA